MLYPENKKPERGALKVSLEGLEVGITEIGLTKLHNGGETWRIT